MDQTVLRRKWLKTAGAVAATGWLLGVTWAFAHQQPEAASAFFAQKVAPVLEQNCLSCHGEKIQRSALDLRSQQAILRGGSRGPAVVPGSPEKSLLYRMITHVDEPAMPMGMPKLSEPEIALIAEWIRQLPQPSSAAHHEAGAPIRPQGSPITEKDRAFWSFIKPVRPQVPKVKNRAWVRNEIDAFVLNRLEAKGLAPAPPAEPRALIRRVYINLTGLPPSPEEVEAFAKNPTDAAYAKTIDGLLDSPHYGERWGRHWLDLARYADSGGYEFDIDRPNAWRYRDWVIKAFNEDMPYDQFIREQLAGDQLKPGDAQAMIATGFCRNGPTVDNASNEETRMDELDDMVTTTSSVFLGLTVGCARCHDHKYDPIPQKDYYRMQAIFFPSQKVERPLVSADDEAQFKAANKAVDEKIKPLRRKVLEIERPHREKLLADKVEFHLRLAQSAGALSDEGREPYRKMLAERFAKDVQLQPEEVNPLLTPEEKAARNVLVAEIEALTKTRPDPLPAAMAVSDTGEDLKSYLLKRGDFRQKGEEVNPGFPAALAGGGDIGTKNRRKQLADWIASGDNPLTARVGVNRIWQYHFGKGIVRTPSDFGATGDRPSHPELLDWLAGEFLARGWRWKAIHRLILMSNTYRQSSRFDPVSSEKDPDNRLLWRMSPRRLEAEALRDAILSLSGKLNRKMGGPGVYPRIDPTVIATGSRPRWPLDVREGEAEWRRSVYVFVKRSVLVPLIEVFDCPVTTVSAPTRSSSTVSPQALALMNNEFVLEQAGYFAERVLREAGPRPRARVSRAFRIALARDPAPQEQRWATEFIRSQAQRYAERKVEAPERAALRDFCHALINLNEFLYLD